MCRQADRQSPDGKIIGIIDFSDTAFKDSPPIKVSLAIMTILQDHFPERLHSCVIWNHPSYFKLIWNACYPFMASDTRQRVDFGKNCDAPALQMLHSKCEVAQHCILCTCIPLNLAWCPHQSAAGYLRHVLTRIMHVKCVRNIQC